MYQIFAGNTVIYSPTMLKQNRIVFNPHLNMELNKASTLTFTVPSVNVKKDLLRHLETEIFVYDNERRIFRGRIISDTKDFWQNDEITCEGELAYLRDRIMRPYDWTDGGVDIRTYFGLMLAAYNGTREIETYKKFTPGQVTVTGEVGEYANDQYPDVLSEMTEKLLNVNGGYFVPRYENGNNYLDYLKDPGNNQLGAQTIRYAKNLLDITDEHNAAPVFTVVIPLGAQVETGETDESGSAIKQRLTIADVNDEKDYLALDEAVEKYGWIENVVTHDEITDAEELLAAGTNDLKDAVKIQRTLEISAIDLSLVNEDDEPLTLGKQYQILFEAGGYTQTSDRVRLNRMELDLQNPAESRYYFGELFYGITHEAVTTKRTMNQVTKVAIETAAQTGELVTKVTELETKVNAMQTKVNALKSQTVTVNGITWAANANGGKTATVNLAVTGVTTSSKCAVNVTTANVTVAVCGIRKTAGNLAVTLLNFGETDPATLNFDVQIM